MKISIVIPTLNEARHIERTLQSIASQPLSDSLQIELLIADGGSTDGTTEKIIAFFDANETLPIRMFLSEKGRAKQLNCGAHFAAGDAILFLHADTTLSDNAFLELAKSLENPTVQFGYFAMKFDADHPIANFYASATRVNSLLTHYGDSGIFARTEFFNRIGKFAEQDFLEDVEFLSRARRYAEPHLVSTAYVVTSARRFEKNGYIGQMLANIGIIGLYTLGANPNWLKQFYKDTLS